MKPLLSSMEMDAVVEDNVMSIQDIGKVREKCFKVSNRSKKVVQSRQNAGSFVGGGNNENSDHAIFHAHRSVKLIWE